MRKRIFSSCLKAVSTGVIFSIAFSNFAFAENINKGIWEQKGNVWKFHKQDGTFAKGFIQFDGDWYYLDEADSSLKTGWFKDKDGNWYFFNTLSDGKKGKMLTGWQWIDGYCYYLSQAKDGTQGRMLANTITPDKFKVNADGRWFVDNSNGVYIANKGQITKNIDTKKQSNLAKGSLKGISSHSDFSSASSGGQSLGRGYSYDNIKDTEATLINKAQTHLVEQGHIEFATIGFNSGNINDYNIFINDTDVTGSVTKVDDEGKLVKWATTINKPKNLKIVRKSDNKIESFTYQNGTNESKPELGSVDDLPKYILTNGAISLFDFHLDNYDENGEIRKEEKFTSFDLSNKRKLNISKYLPTAFYSPDVEIDDEGHGSMLIKLALDENSKKWFEGTLNLKMLNSENVPINNNLTISEKTIENTHGMTGVIKIDLPQTSVRNNGYYYVNISSSFNNDKVTVPIQLVRKGNWKLELSGETPNPSIGSKADVLFEILDSDDIDRNFGNELGIKSTLNLTYPDGKIRALKNLKEYSLIGNSLHIYETYKDENGDEQSVIDQAGQYKLSLKVSGYKELDKKFTIGSSIALNTEQATDENDTVDTYSHATSGSFSGSISNSKPDDNATGGLSINTYLLFNHDLIMNAMILNDLGIGNDESSAVVKRYLSSKPEGVLSDDLHTIYSYQDYLNKVKDEESENNKALSFAQYLRTNTRKLKRITNIKRVLEDGKLGPTIRYDSLLKEDVGVVNGLEAGINEDFKLSFENSAYLDKLKDVYLDGRSIKTYKIEDGKLVIPSDVLKKSSRYSYIGEHKIMLYAIDYKLYEAKLKVKRPEGTLTISKENNIEFKENQDIKFNISFANVALTDIFKDIDQLLLINKNTNRSDEILKYNEGTLNTGYKLEGDKLVISSRTISAGNYKLIFKTKSYGQAEIEFEVRSNNNQASTNNMPKYKASTYQEKAMSDVAKYRIEFEIEGKTDSDVESYLKKVTEVKVNDKTYIRHILGDFNNNQYKIAAKDLENGGEHCCLYVAANGFDKQENIVTIKAAGYDDLSFTINKTASNSENTQEPDQQEDDKKNKEEKHEQQEDEPTANVIKAPRALRSEYVPAKFMTKSKYVVELEAKGEEIDINKSMLAWLENAKVSVNGIEYKITTRATTLEDKECALGQSNNNYIGGARKYLHLEATAFTKDRNEVKIEKEGYTTISFSVKKEKTADIDDFKVDGVAENKNPSTEDDTQASEGENNPSKKNPDEQADEDKNKEHEAPESGDLQGEDGNTSGTQDLKEAPNYRLSGNYQKTISLETNGSTFKNENEILEYINKVNVTMNGEKAVKVESKVWAKKGEKKYWVSLCKLIFHKSALDKGKVILECEGYKNIEIDIE